MTAATQDFVTAIGLEAQAMEATLHRCTQAFYDTPRLQGKQRWYSVGLESIDSEKSKDAENKKGVIRKMIDAILAFIKRIVEGIKKFFQRNGGSDKEQEQFLKNRKGPTDKQLRATLDKIMNSDKHARHVVKESIKAGHDAIAKAKQSSATAMKPKSDGNVATLERPEADADLDTAIKQAEEFLGKKFTRQEVVVVFVDERQEKITKALGHKDAVLFCRSLEDGFHTPWQAAVKAVEQLVKIQPKLENLSEMQHESHDVLDNMMRLGDLLKESEDGYNYEDTLTKWIAGGDSSIASRSLSYTGNRFVLEDAGNYAEAVGRLVEGLKNESSDEAMENLRWAKKVLMDLTPFIAMSVRLGNAHKTAYQMLVA